MSRLFVITIGFDEKFPLRAVVRRGISPGDRVLLLTAHPIDERNQKAISMFKRMLNNLVENVKIEVLEVPVEDLPKAVKKIRSKVNELKTAQIELNLSGGMRALFLEVLLALVSMPIISDVPIEVELEDGRAVITAWLSWFRAPIPSYEDLIIMRAISEKGFTTLDELVDHFTEDIEGVQIVKYPRSTLHRKLSKLVKAGLVSISRKGRKAYYQLTKLGEMHI